MRYCPITYKEISDQVLYSNEGLKLLSPTLKKLEPLMSTTNELRAQAIDRAGKMSIQGVQLKLSAVLNLKEERFELVDKDGRYILKPQSEFYPELPENEALTMTLASMIGIDVPLHGLLYAKDHKMTYFIKRFDRLGRHQRVAVEDFAQLLQLKRETKYQGSMEKVVDVIENYCSFPKIEMIKLFKISVFNFLIGNEDMHLKNFSLMSRDNKVTLSPAYDLLNTTIALSHPKEEFAIPLNGKKNNLKKSDLIKYFGEHRMQLNQRVIEEATQAIKHALPAWKETISISFLSSPMKEKYLQLLTHRFERLFS